VSAPLEPTGTVRVRYGYRPVVVAPRRQLAADYARSQGVPLSSLRVVTEPYHTQDVAGPVIVLDGESSHFPLSEPLLCWLSEREKRGDITIVKAYC
jgi:hypothetical protein